MSESRAIATAVATVKDPPAHWGADARAAAGEAAGQWEAMKGASGHVSSGLGAGLQHLKSTVRTADGRGRR